MISQIKLLLWQSYSMKYGGNRFMTSNLTPQEAHLFYRLWLPLLDYVNQTHQINPFLTKIEKAEELNIPNIRAVSDYLWNHPSVIDSYLNTAKLSSEHSAIVTGWKHFVRDQFILERHLQKGSVFIPLNDDRVYIVSGIDLSFEEMFADIPLPLLLETTLIPFNGKIISDGMITHKNVPIGIGYIDAFSEIYITSKKEKTFQTSLDSV